MILPINVSRILICNNPFVCVAYKVDIYIYVCVWTDFVIGKAWIACCPQILESFTFLQQLICWSFWPKLVTPRKSVEIRWPNARRIDRFRLVDDDCPIGGNFFGLLNMLRFKCENTSTERCDAVWTCLTPGVPRTAEPSVQIWGGEGARKPLAEMEPVET